MTSELSRYRGCRFPPEIIAHAVWLYFRFSLSFRDVEDLAQRGIMVTHETIRPWGPHAVPSTDRRLRGPTHC